MAAEGEPQPRNTLFIAPYVWAPNLSGKVGFGPLAVPVDLKATDLAGSISAAALGYAQYSRDHHFVYAEFLGFRFKDTRFEEFRDQNVKAQLIVGEGGYGQHFALKTTFPVPGTTLVSPYIGVRYTSLNVEVIRPLRSIGAKDHWVDPALGAIVFGPLYGPLTYALKLDAAGFGLGTDHYWSSITALQYRFARVWSVGLGYRISRFNADPGGDNDLDLNLRGAGPEAGLTYTFTY